MNSIQTFTYSPTGEHGTQHLNHTSLDPVKVAVVTSVRDTGVEDQNGVDVDVPGLGTRRMMGSVEFLTRAIQEGRLRNVQIAGVITDDDPDNPRDTDLIRGSGYAFSPYENGDTAWIFDRSLYNGRGEKLTSLTHNLPSTFRTISSSETKRKAASKLEFEEGLCQLVRDMGASILLSDHLMMRLDRILDDDQLGIGKVLNIHPAVTEQTSPYCCRGKTPTADALLKARSHIGFLTGATFHIIDRIIDNGPAVAVGVTTPVLASMQPHELRYYNYLQGKNPVLLAGLQHYIDHITPVIDHINFEDPDSYHVTRQHVIST